MEYYIRFWDENDKEVIGRLSIQNGKRRRKKAVITPDPWPIWWMDRIAEKLRKWVKI